MSAFDLRTRLQLPPRESEKPPMNVVVLHDRELICLLVDTISDIIFVEEESFSPTPPTLDVRVQNLIYGAYKLENELVVELNIEKVLQVSM